MKIRTIQGDILQYDQPAHTVIDTVVIWNYFCLKIDCFFVFFRRYRDPRMCCPKCGETKDVIFRESK